jgi:hypothetical protein
MRIIASSLSKAFLTQGHCTDLRLQLAVDIEFRKHHLIEQSTCGCSLLDIRVMW